MPKINRINYSPLNDKNYIINGALDFWQRIGGNTYALSSSAASGVKAADRWYLWNGSASNHAATISRTTSPTGIGYGMKIQRNSGQTAASNYQVVYNMETIEAQELGGKTVTLSFYGLAGSDYSASGNLLQAFISYGTGGTDRNLITEGLSGTTGQGSINVTLVANTWVQYSLTVNLPAGVNQVAIGFKADTTGTASTNDFFQLAQIQLTEGPLVIPFRRAGGNIAGELAKCKRYYEKSYRTDDPVQTTTNTNAFQWVRHNLGDRKQIEYEVEKRVVPTLSIYNPESGVINQFRDISSGTSFSAGSFGQIGTKNMLLDENASGWSSLPVGNAGLVHWAAESEI